MKKIIFILLSLIAISIQVDASDADFFNLDEAKLSTEMYELNQLEEMILSNGYNQSFFDFTSTNISSMPFSGLNLNDASNPTILPPFIWGCIGGPIGIAIVYVLSDQDSKATMRSFWGCLLGSCVYGSFGGGLFSTY